MSGIKVEPVTQWDTNWNAALMLRARNLVELQTELLADLLKRSTDMYLVKNEEENPLLFLAAIPLNFMGYQAYIWMLPFKDLTARHMRYALPAFQHWARNYDLLSIQIFQNDKRGKRFAEFFGFEKMAEGTDCSFYVRRS